MTALKQAEDISQHSQQKDARDVNMLFACSCMAWTAVRMQLTGIPASLLLARSSVQKRFDKRRTPCSLASKSI